ncbi:hypothetical protein IEO21_10806 [Rhodonia placenta]|uniref:Uncharacterized protein n=2 Tax=Rhodonia placenta TaxID=104341 RepID=A0A8H7NRS5_9APHY|nr:hypothetical protein IEO21_10806 [Postia placenta]
MLSRVGTASSHFFNFFLSADSNPRPLYYMPDMDASLSTVRLD